MNLTKEDVIKGKRFLKKVHTLTNDFLEFKDEIKIYILKSSGNEWYNLKLLENFPDSLYLISGWDFKKLYLEIKFKSGSGISKFIYATLNTERKKHYIYSRFQNILKTDYDIFSNLLECFVDEDNTDIIEYCLKEIHKIDDKISQSASSPKYKEFMRICKLKCL